MKINKSNKSIYNKNKKLNISKEIYQINKVRNCNQRMFNHKTHKIK